MLKRYLVRLRICWDLLFKRDLCILYATRSITVRGSVEVEGDLMYCRGVTIDGTGRYRENI